MCTEHEPFGRLEGNVNHGHARFGTYILGPSFPRAVVQTIAANGLTDLSTCAGFTSAGDDRGVGYAIADNVDYGNVFVGQYDVGDVQYRDHLSIDNLNLLCAPAAHTLRRTSLLPHPSRNPPGPDPAQLRTRRLR